MIGEAQRAGAVEFDPEKRTAIYERGVDRVNQMNYILPMADLPMVFVHSKDVRVAENPLRPIDTRVGDFMWSR